jgi:antitoxin component of RelBE/YafQ-DinJ toxin-antitoxin module
MGLSVSDAIRLLLVRVAAERALPFEVKVPNANTRAAISELEEAAGRPFDSVAELLADLNARIERSTAFSPISAGATTAEPKRYPATAI